MAAVEPEKAALLGPIEWGARPEQVTEQGQFREVFDQCLKPLPPRVVSAFTLREVEGLTSEEICDILSVKTGNLWVMLHRARTHLRHCLEVNWFRREGAKR